MHRKSKRRMPATPREYAAGQQEPELIQDIRRYAQQVADFARIELHRAVLTEGFVGLAMHKEWDDIQRMMRRKRRELEAKK